MSSTQLVCLKTMAMVTFDTTKDSLEIQYRNVSDETEQSFVFPTPQNISTTGSIFLHNLSSITLQFTLLSNMKKQLQICIVLLTVLLLQNCGNSGLPSQNTNDVNSKSDFFPSPKHDVATEQKTIMVTVGQIQGYRESDSRAFSKEFTIDKSISK